MSSSTSEKVKILKDKGSMRALLDDVFETLKDSGGEVYISGVDERKFLEADRTALEDHIKRLQEYGITERLLVREENTFFFPGPQSWYRLVPEKLFNPTLMYVYGEKLAMVLWGPPVEVIIIQNTALADAYRKQFLFMWERAQMPPIKKITEDEKVRLEQAIVKRYGGRVSSVVEADREMFRDFLSREKTTTYGNSWYYLCQAANGNGDENLGLKYFDGEMLTTLGVFNRASLGGGWHYVMNHPIGVFDPKKIFNLAKKMLKLSAAPVYVKKITTEQKESLLDMGFSPIEEYPWHNQAMEEDDTYPEQIIDVHDVVSAMQQPGKRALKNQFTYFVSRTKEKRIRFENLDELTTADATSIVKQFFEYLESRELHVSRASDYDNIIFHPPLGKNGRSYFSQIVYINDQPAGFFAMEPISHDTAGLYAGIALHEEFPALSEYLIIQCCKILKTAGYTYFNLGGSETAGLFQFKEKFSPVQYNKMHWVVYKI